MLETTVLEPDCEALASGECLMASTLSRELEREAEPR